MSYQLVLNNLYVNARAEDILFVPDLKLRKVLTFEIDCVKIFRDTISIHGHLFGKYINDSKSPKEYTLGPNTYGRILFHTMEEAREFLDKKRGTNETISNN